MTRRTGMLLSAWRAAQRRLEQLPEGDPAVGAARVEVARAWLDYQLETGAFAADEAVVLVDEDGRYVAVSPNLEGLFGVSPDDVLMRRFDELAPAAGRDSAEAAWRTLRETGSYEAIYRTTIGLQQIVQVVARANHPIPGLHLSRHRPLGAAGVNPGAGTAERAARTIRDDRLLEAVLA